MIFYWMDVDSNTFTNELRNKMEILKVDNSVEIHTIDDLKSYYERIKSSITKRMSEFKNVGKTATNNDLFRELVFCILTANASAKMGLRSINVLDSTIFTGTAKDIENKLRGVYRFPTTRADYIFRTRLFLQQKHLLNLSKIFEEHPNQLELREYLTQNVVGIGFKECSHFLRNVGFTGFAILDKHVISMLNLLGANVRKPKNKREYKEIEQIMIDFAKCNKLDFDELDLLFWSYKTGEIIK